VSTCLQPGQRTLRPANSSLICSARPQEEHLLRESMSGVEARLDPCRFVRIHRSTIVNIERIQELQPAFHGDYAVTLHGGKELALSRSFREKLEEALGHSL
jgi:two-component system LytT family response regulator